MVKDLLLSSELTNSSHAGRIVSALSGIAIIGVALTEKKSSTISKWLKIGTGATLVLRAISGFRAENKLLGVNKTGK